MNVIRCKNGHFYDGDTYTQCPHCGAGAEAAPITVPKEEKKGFWGRSRRAKGVSQPITETIPTSKISEKVNISSNAVSEEGNAEKHVSDISMQLNPNSKKEHTLDFWQASVHSQSSGNSTDDCTVEALCQGEVLVESEDAQNKSDTSSLSDNGGSANQTQRPITTDEQSPLKAALQRSSSGGEGKTMSYFNVAVSAGGVQESHKQSDPVVGWLICISGKHFGDSFSLYAGKNSIGRSSENRVVIPLDNAVSRSKHAIIVYEPKKRNFFLQPGDSNGLTYLNDEYITESKKLNTNDVIELGDSKLMFIALCGEKFSWEEYLPKGE